MIKILFICTFIASFTWGNKTDTLTPDSPKSIHGIVTDSVTGKPIPEVIIMVKGTEIGTVTNAEGHYKMVTLKNSALVFSKEGMKTQEIPVGEESEINIQMKKETKDTKPQGGATLKDTAFAQQTTYQSHNNDNAVER